MIAGRRRRTGGKSELRRAGWFVTRTPSDRRKVPQKIYRPFTGVRVKWRGKSSPLSWRHERHGKPHLEQDQIGKRLRAARPKFPGRSLEVPGDRHPREMIMARLAGYRIRLTAHSNFLFGSGLEVLVVDPLNQSQVPGK